LTASCGCSLPFRKFAGRSGTEFERNISISSRAETGPDAEKIRARAGGKISDLSEVCLFRSIVRDLKCLGCEECNNDKSEKWS
jgi:hypothetical protein